MMNEEQTSSHHVAWADRIGLNKQWARDIEACSDSYGSPSYHHMVRRFKNNIPNIRNGPQLNDIINEKEHELFTISKKELLDEWFESYPQESDNESYVLQKEDEINMHLNENLYRFIIQLLEDQGFGFYKSKVDEVEQKMI